MCQYMCKMPDSVREASKDGNEFDDFERCRYVSATEAIWRFFEYPVNTQEPSVKRLVVHEQGNDLVVYEEDEDPQQAADRSVSTLSRYFGRPLGENFDRLTYRQYYEQ